jgi:hypothetical protein
MGIFITDDQLITTLCKLKITPSQHFVLYNIHMKNWNGMNKFNRETGGIPHAEYKDLVDKGIILDGNKKGEWFLDVLLIKDSIATVLFVDIDQAGQELWERYPNCLYFNGTSMPTKSTDKDVVLKKYMDNIACNPVRHERVMELLAYAVTNGMITMGIEKWVKSAQWEVLETEYGNRTDDNGTDAHGEREV